VENQQLIAAFAEKYSEKYSFYSLQPIGEGAYAQVFKARDLNRDIDVAIKLYHGGTVPDGSDRGWIITSKINNSQIASTFTIEIFTGSDDIDYKAVVSRFVPGKSLNDIMKWYDTKSPEDKKLITDDFVHSLLPSLLSIVEFCHSLGYGHGDLHGGNVMIFPSEINSRYEFTPVLIDFDNSSLKTEFFAATESEKIDKDCRTIKNKALGIAPWILRDWEWCDEVEGMFVDYNTVREYRTGFRYVLQFTELVKKGTLTNDKIIEILFSVGSMIMSGFRVFPIIECLRKISIKSGRGNDFEVCLSHVQSRISDGSALHVEVEITEYGNRKNQLYLELFQ